MEISEASEQLSGCEYGDEGSLELFDKMDEHGLVAVFGASDDLMEFRGKIYDELGAYNGTTAYLDSGGLLVNDCDSDECPHFERDKESAQTIEAIWDKNNIPWTYKTSIPHTSFKVMEDGEIYCVGIVFKLCDAAIQKQDA